MKPLFSYILFLTVFILSSCDRQLPIVPGVSIELAQQRKANVEVLLYDLKFDIPHQKDSLVSGAEIIHFNWKENTADLTLDFTAKEGSVISLMLNDKESKYTHINGHLIIPNESLEKGANKLVIQFVSSDLSLNRNEDFLYTLFVPDRASSAFPCFDQPDMKANYLLSLSIPKRWKAVSNSKIMSEQPTGDSRLVVFDQTEKISTYLFSFVAGVFDHEQMIVDGLPMNVFHREKDVDLFQKNRVEIFNLHAQSIRWMEEYTGIDYPFGKIDFVLIPGFQYGGMEHVGAIQYRSEMLMLEESSSVKEKLRRANVIAHETAHMWFGNLVTMKWFDDVWMKEVFANFMADKMIKESFPSINHDLNFLFAHYPQAYSVDRTLGTNPIQQTLDNLQNAGNLYGSIIYHKAPIVMKQLEPMVGENAFRQVLRDYLENYAYGNADWDDLVSMLDRVTDKDIKSWSDVWIKKTGRPHTSIKYIDKQSEGEFVITQSDVSGANKVWQQSWDVTFDYQGGPVDYRVYMNEKSFSINKTNKKDLPSFIQLNSNGMGYGVFSQGLSYVKDEFIFEKSRVDISEMGDERKRGAGFVNLHEFLLEEGFHPQLYHTFLEVYMASEENDLILSYLLNNMSLVFKRFFTPNIRKQHAHNLEVKIWDKLLRVSNPETKSILIDYYIDLVSTEKGLEHLKELWKGENLRDGLFISDRQKESLAMNIAFKGNIEDMIYLEMQMDSTVSKDKLAKLQFLKPVFSKSIEERNAFFELLKQRENREHETWVLTALHFLHHPYRDESSIDYVKPSLELLEELQSTGDIFFPKRWLDATLSGYQSKQASDIVRQFLDENKGLDPQLRMKLLQSSDMLFRAQENIAYYEAL